MKSYDEYAQTARIGYPFSNSTEWDIWHDNVCEGGGDESRRCINDDDEVGCPLILLALTERHPAEFTGPRGRYRCTEKVTPADSRRAEREAERAAIEEQHYGPLFELGEVQ
ncbi:hypothetical protein GV791_14730 [Nocardia cyriacigeorgica]|uniref:Uncharacterized protein n=1 Tax=Nocardia cyriacigeorgica TaxID=135487 RepID=A0A6P1CML3_9NOCA|nr:hypothetical protein [Nocardia cyriacigeorgica]NEW33811.1 hypothetical protein [Nocardia cyriacigeorgica]